MKKETKWTITYFENKKDITTKQYKGTLSDWLRNCDDKTIIRAIKNGGIK